MEKLEHEAAAKGNRILTLEQEKSRLEDLSSSVKLTVSEQAKTISELKRGVERNTADLALKDLRIEALSRVRKKENDSAYQSMQEIIAEKEQRITDLNGRLTECHRRLKRLSSGDPTSAAQERFEATVGNVDGRIRRTKAPSPIPTTPAYERLKELSCSFARANRGQDHAATVIFPMQRASQWQ
jgi:predicted nuclease with TOPRIM domain